MPHYFFRFKDGDEVLRDDEGQEFDGPEKARRMLIEVMCDLATDSLPDGDHHEFRARMFDKDQTLLYETSLILDGRWVVPKHM